MKSLLVVVSLLASCGELKEVKYIPGPKGEPGADGRNGTDGKNGVDGTNGRDGKDGTSCTTTSIKPNSTTPNGSIMISCTDGTKALIVNGVDGKDGTNGTDGKNGADGTNGVDGKNGTVIQSINLCRGQTTYPSMFVEVAFCIGGNLYAVYSANGGFMTMIPPGTYSSSGINSTCTFTVKESCQVVVK
jgi:hypothetical protein